MSRRNPTIGVPMVTCALFALVLLLLGIGSSGCQGLYEAVGSGGGGGGGGEGECPADKLHCVGDIDNGVVCTCAGEVWDPCTKYPGKCTQMPVPQGGSGWDCTWSEFRYTCTSTTKSPAPTGGSDWICSWDDVAGQWVCVKKELPAPPGGGAWSCSVDDETLQLVCTPKTGGSGGWSCSKDAATGKTVCTRSGTLPPGGDGDWSCHQSDGSWVCVGPSKTAPGGSGWQCVKVKTELGQDLYRCTKSAGDVPPGGGSWTCMMGSELGGSRCEQQPGGGKPPLPKVGGACAVGDKAWCDGNTFCGWGQVICDPATGSWKTTAHNGKVVLDCNEVKNLVPNTVCACYHFFYNPDCCERADCVIPPGSSGQVCPKSKGKLCDHCNPLSPECSEPGGKCIVSNSNETFCGRACSTAQPCPAGYSCMSLKVKLGTVLQCVPADLSCYY